jgi:hypothetical protein
MANLQECLGKDIRLVPLRGTTVTFTALVSSEGLEPLAMKPPRTVGLSMLLIALGSGAAPAPPSPASLKGAEAAAAVSRLLDECAAAYVKHDAASIDRILGEEFVMSTGRRELQTRAARGRPRDAASSSGSRRVCPAGRRVAARQPPHHGGAATGGLMHVRNCVECGEEYL